MNDQAVDDKRRSFFSLRRMLIVLAALIFFALLWATANPYRRYWIQQRQLASDLGVEIGDYPLTDVFPVGYFRTALRQGMPASEVHKVVRGYELVFRCDGRGSEVYNYFSPVHAQALRFEISYRSDMSFDSLGTEDAGQRTISIEGCVAGRLGE